MYKLTIELDSKKNFTCPEKDSGLNQQITKEMLLYYV